MICLYWILTWSAKSITSCQSFPILFSTTYITHITKFYIHNFDKEASKLSIFNHIMFHFKLKPSTKEDILLECVAWRTMALIWPCHANLCDKPDGPQSSGKRSPLSHKWNLVSHGAIGWYAVNLLDSGLRYSTVRGFDKTVNIHGRVVMYTQI